MNIPTFDEIIGQNDQIAARAEHLAKLKALIGNAYPNKFERSRVSGKEDTISHLVEFAGQIKDKHIPVSGEGERPGDEQREAANAELKVLGNVRASGRLAVPPRVMGKAAFVHLSDGVNRLQIYVRKQDAKAVSNDTLQTIETENSGWDLFNLLDHGDFLGVEGFLFVTKTGELSIHVETLQFLSKAMLPMPDKIHGISDPELQRRFRYADLIADSLKIEHAENELTTREVFERRARLISGMRRFLDEHGYIEVETPMLTPKATGAAAKPFETFHEALKIPLYARIAPELYLKRLTVGGFEKVYELNRNFRNEGISQKHNPEFTMLEFYCAYMDVNGMMDFAEKMIQESVQKAVGSLTVTYFDDNKIFEVNEPKEINFEKFHRLTMREAVSQVLKKDFEYLSVQFDDSFLDDSNFLLKVYWFIKKVYSDLLSHVLKQMTSVEYSLIDKDKLEKLKSNWLEAQRIATEETEENTLLKSNKDKLLVYIFEEAVESELIQPTFIIDYPKSISPLSKASPQNPQTAERFELFINGMECANGFSELNDPQEQLDRFTDQMKERERGDDEAMVLDEDYIRALSYGMP
ncbi:MAG TPA: amino acid--tRNA ligase-related protein, partial [Pyrinomonadaceae bacterium]|nr:amino acid--tRNA ligase-related protein [Pyrinomonadaceae bacterium]